MDPEHCFLARLRIIFIYLFIAVQPRFFYNFCYAKKQHYKGLHYCWKSAGVFFLECGIFISKPHSATLNVSMAPMNFWANTYYFSNRFFLNCIEKSNNGSTRIILKVTKPDKVPRPTSIHFCQKIWILFGDPCSSFKARTNFRKV